MDCFKLSSSNILHSDVSLIWELICCFNFLQGGNVIHLIVVKTVVKKLQVNCHLPRRKKKKKVDSVYLCWSEWQNYRKRFIGKDSLHWGTYSDFIYSTVYLLCLWVLVRGYFGLVHKSGKFSYFGKHQKIFRRGTIILLAQHETSATVMKINLTEQKGEWRSWSRGWACLRGEASWSLWSCFRKLLRGENWE